MISMGTGAIATRPTALKTFEAPRTQRRIWKNHETTLSGLAFRVNG